MLVSIGDRDFTDTFGEVGALAKRLSEESKEGRSQLMRELAAGRPSGFATASSEEVEAQTPVRSLALGNYDPCRKGPGRGRRLPAAGLEVAEAVADAKGGVKPGETGAIDKITEALGPA